MENTTMKHSRLAIALAAALALPQAVPVLAADTTTTPAASSQTQAPVTRGYLGVTIDRLPDPVRAQLPEAIPREQGLLVEQVIQDSPAARAGLQPFDILLQYNDQKLFSPEQLTRLVGSDSGGQPVKLTVVRGGKVSTLDVTLGESSPPQAMNRLSRIEPHRLSAMPRTPSVGPAQQGRGDNEEVWESFDSLSLDKVGDDKYKAVIGYLADDGTHKRLEFKGSRDEIRQKILAQKNLPATERDQLLDALTARDEVIPFDTWAFGPLEHELLAAPPWWGWNPYF
jgi:membrane-associated protease RseP (regulator of RpoE activity)